MAAAVTTLGSARPMGAARTRLNRLGVQLYTLRDLMQESVERTLEQVAAVGYREVEFAGYSTIRPARCVAGWTRRD